MFTVKQIENLKPKERSYQLREGKGFGIRIYPSGEMVWIFAFQLHGRRRLMTLGAYPELSLKEARDKHGEVRKKVEKGIDPLIEKQEESQEPTVREAVARYLERAEKKGMRSLREERRMVEKYIPRSWRPRKVKTIKRREVRVVVDTLADSAPQMANQFLKALHRFFGFCLDREYVEHNPCARVEKPAPTVSKDRWLGEEEIQTVWGRLETAGMSDEVRRALKLILVTAQRPGEVAGMHTDEIDGRWWTIPAARTKNKLTHRVYLTDFALEIIGQASGFVFPSPKPRSGRTCLNRNSLSHAVSLNGYLGVSRWAPHDLRRTAASHMTSIGVPRLEVGKVLNHSDRTITAVYDRNSYDREKVRAMEAWSRKLTNIITGKKADNVIEFRKG